MQYEVTQNSATEPPFNNEYYNNFEKGIYVDIVSGEMSYLLQRINLNQDVDGQAFLKPIEKGVLGFKMDYSHNMERVEVTGEESKSHLGHVFDDGPKELGGLRFCINSASLRFIPKRKNGRRRIWEILKIFIKLILPIY